MSGLDNMYKKVDIISKQVINIERKVEASDMRIIDLGQGFVFMETEFIELKKSKRLRPTWIM